MWKAPRWVASRVPCAVKANYVAVRIMQVGFPPEPRLISRRGVEGEPSIFELLTGGIKVRAFEIYDHAGVLGYGGHVVQRKGRAADRAFEAGVGR
jgi:hypothetical protein